MHGKTEIRALVQKILPYFKETVGDQYNNEEEDDYDDSDEGGVGGNEFTN